MNDKLYSEIEKLEKKYVSIWEDVCNIESPTNDKAGVDEVGNYFINLAKSQGWDVEVFEQAVAGNVVSITMNKDAKLPPVTLSGHTDTVHPKGMFGYPAVKCDGDKIYGPGVTDCKGGIVAGFFAMEALGNIGFDKRPIRMLLQTDEEVGSRISNKATINYICEKARDSVAFLNLESNAEPAACIQRKGIIAFEFTVYGEEAHSSMCAVAGANAILDAAHKIIELEKLKDTDGLTCTCGLISGGTAKNTVPGKCAFTADIRYATSEQYEWVCKHVQEIASTVHVGGCRCEVKLFSSRPAMERTEKNVRLFEKMNEIFRESGLAELREFIGVGGSDAADTTVAGIPTVDCVGATGDKIHTKDEFAYLASLTESTKRLALVALHI